MALELDDKTEALEEQIVLIDDLSSDIIDTQTLGKSLASDPTKIIIFKVRLSNIQKNWMKFYLTAIKAKCAAARLDKPKKLAHITDLISHTREAFYEALATEIPSCEGAYISLGNEYDNKPIQVISTTKPSIVLDASMQASRGSINSQLITSPPLQSDIENNFKHPDNPLDQDIIYRSTPSEKVQESPCLALRELKQPINNETPVFPLAASSLQNSMNIDNVFTKSNATEENVIISPELQKVIARDDFELNNSASNPNSGVEFISEDLRDITSPHHESYEKPLGMIWNPNSSKLCHKVLTPSVRTNQSISSTIARQVSRLGYLSPINIKTKQLIQKPWPLKIKLDESSPNNSSIQSEIIILDEKTLETIYISHCNMPFHTLQPFTVRFADISDLRYTAAIYLRSKSIEREDNSNLLASKIRIAPVKTLLILRLELSADNIRRYRVKKNFSNFSSTLLSILATTVMARTRSLRILQSSSLENWYHVSSKDNPADIASRGIPSSLQDSVLWWQGPAWLRKDSSEWTLIRASSMGSKNLPEIKTDSTLLCHIYPTDNSENEWLIKISSFSKIQRVTAYILRIINNSKKNFVRMAGSLSLKEILEATKVCIKMSQNHFYRKELLLITNGKGDKTQLSSLAPFLDSLGVLRVGGRLQNSPLTYEAKYPIISYPKSHLTTKLVDHLHKSYLHARPQLLQSLIRRQYWIRTQEKLYDPGNIYV